jgi:hypothetical protein
MSNRPIAVARQQRRTSAPEQPRGPVQSINSAQAFANQQRQLQQQQQQQQQQQLKQSQLKQQLNHGSSSQYPSQVTIPHAISVIIARLNNLESKTKNAFSNLQTQGVSAAGAIAVENDESPNELDMAIQQIFERIALLETSATLNSIKLDESVSKITKLENDLRDSKDIILKLQTFTIDTTKDLLTMKNRYSSSTNEERQLSLKEIVQSELI